MFGIIVSLLVSWLLGFLASWLFGFSASGLFGFLLVYAAFGGFLAFAAFRWFMRLLVALAFRMLCFHSTLSLVLDLASRIISITSSSLFASSLLRTSWGGKPPPQPTRYSLDCLNQHFFEHHGGAIDPPATF